MSPLVIEHIPDLSGFYRDLAHLDAPRPVGQVCTSAMVNETTIMQAKAKLIFMRFPSET
jgi:hypothetical protein